MDRMRNRGGIEEESKSTEWSLFRLRSVSPTCVSCPSTEGTITGIAVRPRELQVCFLFSPQDPSHCSNAGICRDLSGLFRSFQLFSGLFRAFPGFSGAFRGAGAFGGFLGLFGPVRDLAGRVRTLSGSMGIFR
jgi:hypothetical protein